MTRGLCRVRDSENWNCLLSQLYEVADTPYKYGLVEGARGSYMVKGYYGGPGATFKINEYWNVLFYGGIRVVTSPFGETSGKVNINPQYGEAKLNKTTYNLMQV
ncbi:MAG: hypothetical protein NTX05_07635 [Fusobacteria bacterium]|nr:hypothetical protein [Fusobacteriota bacterium]